MDVLPMRVTSAKKLRMSPTRTGCLKMNWLTATVAMRPVHMARGHHGARQVNLGHDPAAKDVAIGVAVRRHGDDLEYQFLVCGQGDGLKA
jgi:hypothetical protein